MPKRKTADAGEVVEAGSQYAPDLGAVFDTDTGRPLVVGVDGTLTPLDDNTAYPTPPHPERDARILAAEAAAGVDAPPE